MLSLVSIMDCLPSSRTSAVERNNRHSEESCAIRINCPTMNSTGIGSLSFSSGSHEFREPWPLAPWIRQLLTQNRVGRGRLQML